MFLVPPSIGLSDRLLNGNHDAVYHDDCPRPDGRPLRRHGDHVERLDETSYRALGRVDDTMNLGGIKVSSAEIERVVSDIEGLAEVAAIAVAPPEGGPVELVMVAVPVAGYSPNRDEWRVEMQAEIRRRLNPLFRVSEVVVVDELPRTASAKVVRRILRDDLGASQ